MATTAIPYVKFLQKLLESSTIDLSDGGTVLRVTLHADTYTPNRDTDEYYGVPATLKASELPNANGYTAGGFTLTGVAVGVNGTSHFAYLDADDCTWPLANFTCRYAVLRDATPEGGTPDGSVSPLLGYWDFGGNQAPTTGFTLQFPTPASGAVIKVG